MKTAQGAAAVSRCFNQAFVALPLKDFLGQMVEESGSSQLTLVRTTTVSKSENNRRYPQRHPVGRGVHVQGDAALTARTSRLAKCFQEPAVLRRVDHPVGSSIVTHVGTNIKITSNIHDPLSGQKVVDLFRDPEAHAIDSVFCHQTTAFNI